MKEKILVTGGAGFIGSHIVDALIKKEHFVRIIDNLDPQVHGYEQEIPDYLNREAEFLRGDLRDTQMLKRALDDIEIVFHEAAAVGIAQSMYEIKRYVYANSLGGANLLDLIVNSKNKVKKIIVASSMSVYGEGAYECPQCGVVYPGLRKVETLEKKEWEQKCPICKMEISQLPTKENKPLAPTSIYAITKRDHEEMFLSVGTAFGIPTVCLRYFNVYGPRQSLSNPYTGIVAIALSRLFNHKPPLIFEDGRQTRDFVYVSDIVQANILAMEKEQADFKIFNVGTGDSLSIIELSTIIAKKMGVNINPVLLHKYRTGDIRHCIADISAIKNNLGYVPEVSFEKGIVEVIRWAASQKCTDLVSKALMELDTKGLTK